MVELATSPGLAPFLFSGLLVVGLMLLEVAFMMVGFNTQIGGTPDIDLDADLGAGPDIDIGADSGIDLSDIEMAHDIEASTGKGGVPGTVVDMLGMRNLPLTVWLALFSASFAAIGLAGQMFLDTVLGFMLPGALAAAAVVVPAIWLTRKLSAITARLLPRETTTAISERSYGRRRGTVTVGVSRRGSPAQVRFTDTYGNLHHLMAEPLDDKDAIPEGSDVLIIRIRNGELRLVKVS